MSAEFAEARIVELEATLAQAERQVQTLRDEIKWLWDDWEKLRKDMVQIHERDLAELNTLRSQKETP